MGLFEDASMAHSPNRLDYGPDFLFEGSMDKYFLRVAIEDHHFALRRSQALSGVTACLPGFNHGGGFRRRFLESCTCVAHCARSAI